MSNKPKRKNYSKSDLTNYLDRELQAMIRGGQKRPFKYELIAFMAMKWHLDNADFLGFELMEGETFSYHHTRVKKCEGGPITVYNGSVLARYSSHPFYHTVYDYDKDRGIALREILIEINDQVSPPTRNQLIRADEIFKSFEREYCGYRSVKNEPLIKECYTRRLIQKNAYYFYK